jgi:hypothetical protein
VTNDKGEKVFIDFRGTIKPRWYCMALDSSPRPRIARNHNRKMAEAKRLRMVNARRSKRPAT